MIIILVSFQGSTNIYNNVNNEPVISFWTLASSINGIVVDYFNNNQFIDLHIRIGKFSQTFQKSYGYKKTTGKQRIKIF